MDTQERLELIKRDPTEEVVTEEELSALLESGRKLVAYDGFEPSGLLHLGSGMLRTIKTNDFTEAGVEFIIYIADWFAYLNNKLGGDLEKIRKVGEYFIEGWKACGMDMKSVKFVWASELVKDPEYWETFLKLSTHTTVKRVMRAVTIAGRKESEVRSASLLVYPLMQATDVLMLNGGKGVDICQLGMDQRKVNMLVRDIVDALGRKKPVAVHHHLLAGLKGARMGKEEEDKMSKSKPDTAIFIHDSREEIERKLRKAYCPEKQVEGNPVLEIARYILFRRFDRLEVKRPEKYGGAVEFLSFGELADAYRKGLHPADLKAAVAEKLDELLEPVRAHFEKGKAAELYEFVRNVQVTR